MTVRTEPSHSSAGAPLWLVLVWDQGREVVALPAGEERAVVIGSGRHADVRIAQARVAPVEFHIERDGGGVWVVPGPPGGLRMNAVRVTGPRRLEGRGILEFAGILLHVRLETEEPERGTPKPEPRVDRAYVAGLPSDTDTTEFAASDPRAAGTSPFQLETVQMDAFSRPEEAVDDQRTELMAPLTPDVSTFDTTVFEAPELPAHSVSPVPVARSGSVPALPGARRGGSVPWGIVAKHRKPALAAAVASLLIALALGVALARKPLAPAAAPAKPPSAPVSARQAVVSPPVAPRAGSGDMITHRVASSAATAPDPEVARAVLHLVAGREDEARRAYAALAARSPDDPALAALARLLARRADARCGGTPAASFCPEVAR